MQESAKPFSVLDCKYIWVIQLMQSIIGFPSKQHLTVPEPSPSASMPTGKGKSVTDFCRSSHISSTSQKRPSSGEERHGSSHDSKRQRTDDDGNIIHKDWVQCTSYAVELLSHGGLRNHVLGVMVSGHSLQLLYYDRSIILASQPFNFMKDKDRLFTLLTALAKFTAREWGYAYPPLNPACLLSSPPDCDSVFEGLSLKLGNSRKLLLKDTLFHQHRIIGRGTCVVRAICLPAEGGDNAEEGDDARANDLWQGILVEKLSWPSATRLSEPETINATRECAIQHGDAWVLNHLPEVLYSEDIDWSLLSPELIEQLGDKYEKRVLRIMVLEELSPITNRTTAPELAQSFRKILRCKLSSNTFYYIVLMSRHRLSMAGQEGGSSAS